MESTTAKQPTPLRADRARHVFSFPVVSENVAAPPPVPVPRTQRETVVLSLVARP